MMLAGLLALLFAFTAHNLIADENIQDSPVNIWKYDLESRRKIIRGILAKHLSNEEMQLSETSKAQSNWSLDDFVDKYLATFNLTYKTPDNYTINNILENNEHALSRPLVFEDSIKKYGIVLDDEVSENEKNKWTFKDFIEKYEPTAVLEQVRDITSDLNLTKGKGLACLVDSLDSTDELLGLSVPGERSGRRWRAGWLHPQPYQQKLKYNEEIQNILLFMKQAIYEARDKMVIMQTLREEYRTTALYKMGYLFAKTDYACKIFSSLSFKSFRTCSMIRQKIHGSYRLYHHYMDVVYNVERLLARWFDVDILKDILNSNDVIARKVLLKDRNLTSPQMVVDAFNEMFID